MSRLQQLVQYLEPDARLTNPPVGENDVFKTKTKKIRRELDDVAKRQPVGFRPATDQPSKERRDLENKLRSRWVGLYLQATVGSGKDHYAQVFGINDLHRLKGRSQRIAVQAVGAVEERLRDAGMTVLELVTSMEYTGSPAFHGDRLASDSYEPKGRDDWRLSFDRQPLEHQQELRDWVFQVAEATRTELALVKNAESALVL